MEYGQFCPIARAAEVLGERWMLLVLRELITGATRYAELQRGLGRISPSVLSQRLKTLLAHGIIERVSSDDGQGFQYRLTESGAELAAVIESVGVWGQRWMRRRMSNEELDVELLMLHLQRSFNGDAFAKNHAVLGFVFSDLSGALRCWWLLVDDERVELCAQSPGRPEDVTLSCRLRTLSEIYMGDSTLEAALGSGRLVVKGPAKLTRNMHQWLQLSPFAGIPAATPGAQLRA